jgi:hypothetical protein
MDEGRKRTVLISAAILLARKWSQLEGRPVAVVDAAITESIALAERILQKIDTQWDPAKASSQRMTSNQDYPWKTKT